MARITTGVATLLWISSWFLPVLADISGWQAFRYAIHFDGEDAIGQALSAATNVVFVILVAHVWRSQVTRPVLFIKIAVACFILDLYWLVQAVRQDAVRDLLVGYYAWIASFALLVVSGVSIHRTSRTPTAGTPA